MRRAFAIVALVLAAGPAGAQPATVRFHIAFTEVREIGPRRIAVPRVADIALQGGNRIVATEDVGNRHKRRRQSDSTLGESYTMFQGRGRQGEWRVEGRDTLVRRSRGRTDTEILVLKASPDGRSCEVGVGYVLFQGETAYFRGGRWFDKVSAEGATCRIAQ